MSTAKTRPIGSLWDVPEGATVVRPDGGEIVVTGGATVLDLAGTYTCGDTTVTAK